MAAPSPVVAKIRSTLARKSQSCPPNDPELHKLRRDLAVEGLAEHAAKVVSGWPPPTPEQLQRIAAILRSASPPGLTTESASGGSTAPRPQSRTELVETRLAELDGGGSHVA
jgi:hypothetical protein